MNTFFGTHAFAKWVLGIVVAFSSVSFSASTAEAQMPPQANVWMVNADGSFHYAMTGLTATNVLGVDVLTGWGTDLATTQFVVVIPTATPNRFVYFIAEDPSSSGPAGTVGVFSITPGQTPAITWQNTIQQGGFAFLF